jgi:hypothetical protein
MMTRRRFLRTAAWTAAPLFAGSIVWHDSVAWLVRRSGARLLAIVQSPAQQLRTHFDYLDLDPAGVDRYLDDCRRYQTNFSRWVPLHPDVHTRYLLSTDFFRHGADESRRVHYVGYFDPSVTPCNNPLASFDEEV